MYPLQRGFLLVMTLVSLSLSACSTNPVTGESELSLLSTEQELAIGQEQYEPSRQSQGGLYTVDEDLNAYVNEVGQRVAAASDRELPYEFSVLNNGVPNAWALPGGKIAVNRGLLVELDNEAELAAVLGHEVVHAAARHGAQAVTRGTLLQGALVAGMLAASNSEFSNLIVGGAQLGAQLINQTYGREAERESDYYGIHYMLEAGYDPSAAVSLQETFVRLSEGRNPGWLQGLFSSHPPSQERVENNRALVQELQPRIQGRDLELGRERYQQAIAFLKESQPAYELFDEAQQAIAEDDLEEAMRKLEQASSMLPEEARFLGLQGDILLHQGRYRQAVATYDEAIERDSRYFDYYLGRGVAHSRLDSEDQARQDLERSTELLPTSVAMNELGKLALEAGNRSEAKQYFEAAAAAEGEVGRQAQQAFISLDLQDNPGNYIQAQAFVDDAGRLMARVTNPTSLDLSNITLHFSAGPGSQQRRVIRSLPASTALDVFSGLAVRPGAAQAGVAVVGAEVD